MNKSKICVLASGGDCPALNACIEAIYSEATANGIGVFAAINGFDGLIDENLVELTPQNATGISSKSGCVFKCGRSKRVMEKDGFASAVSVFNKHGFEALIVLGGNGSAIGVGRFKNAGINTVLIPSTIDNDVEQTKHSLGFSSSVESATKMVDILKATMETSQRDFVVHLMGRGSSQLALRVGMACFADIIDTNDKRHTPQEIAAVFDRNRKMGKTSNVLVMQERRGGAQIQETVESIDFVKQINEAAETKTIQFCTLGYLQRGADPSCYDRFLAVIYGRAAVDCVQRKQYGVCVSAVSDEVVLVDLPLTSIPS